MKNSLFFLVSPFFEVDLIFDVPIWPEWWVPLETVWGSQKMFQRSRCWQASTFSYLLPGKSLDPLSRRKSFAWGTNQLSVRIRYVNLGNEHAETRRFGMEAWTCRRTGHTSTEVVGGHHDEGKRRHPVNFFLEKNKHRLTWCKSEVCLLTLFSWSGFFQKI